MASITRDPRNPRGNWLCCYRLAHGQRTMRSTGTKNKGEAKIICEAWAEAERVAANGHLSTSRAAQIINETLLRCGSAQVEAHQLGPWLTEWLESKLALSPATRKNCQISCAHFLSFLGAGAENRLLDSIQEREIRRFTQMLKGQGRTATTVNRIMRDLSGAFGRAARLGKIRYSPFAGIEPEKDRDKLSTRRTFTPEEVIKLIKTAADSDWEGLILLGYTTGLRLQDGSNLAWNDIDLVAGIINFHQRKTARESVVGLHPDFADWLLRRSVADDPQAHVFPHLAGRPSSGKGGLSNQFNRLVQRAGIQAGHLRERKGTSGRGRRALSFHSLRHTAASTVYNHALAREAARQLTDHAERGALDRYLHIDLGAIKAVTALIPRLAL